MSRTLVGGRMRDEYGDCSEWFERAMFVVVLISSSELAELCCVALIDARVSLYVPHFSHWTRPCHLMNWTDPATQGPVALCRVSEVNGLYTFPRPIVHHVNNLHGFFC